MNLQEAMTRCRTLVVDGRDGLSRTGLIAELAHHGFRITRVARTPQHLDPTTPLRELLAGPGRIAVDGSIVRELVYGPLRRGRSRVTWIQALDFADALAERHGALLHVRDPLPPWCERIGEAADDDDDIRAARAAYDRAFRTLAQHVPVVTVDAAHATFDAAHAAGHPVRTPELLEHRPRGTRNPDRVTVG